MIDIATTLILKEEDLIDPTRNKRADINLDAFQSYVKPFFNSHKLILYLSSKGGYIVLVDGLHALEGYADTGGKS